MGPFQERGRVAARKVVNKECRPWPGRRISSINLFTDTTQLQPSFQNKTDLLDAVDHLPQSVEWKCECITLTGDVRDDDGNAETEELELWFRDPEHLYTSQEGNNRVINEMWTADWWWDMQVSQ